MLLVCARLFRGHRAHPVLPPFHKKLKAIRRKVYSSTLPLVDRGRDTVPVFSEPNPFDGAFKLITVSTSVEASLMIIFFIVSPPDCEISCSWSSLFTVTLLVSPSVRQTT